MEIRKKIIPFIFLFFCQSVFPQYFGANTSISVNTIFNTGARLYPNTSADDNFTRNDYTYLENFLSYSVELKRQLTENIFLGISFERIKVSRAARTVEAVTSSGLQQISVDEGFTAYPVEFSLYYILPVSNENFLLYIGGGAGYYSGEEIRNIGDSGIDSRVKNFAWGIQVQTGLEYMINEYFSVKGEMRFRDPEFEMSNKYEKTVINYNNQIIRLNEKTYDSKVNIDGISFMAGIIYHFNIL